MAYLLTLKQRGDETFEDFMAMFNKEKFTLDNHNGSVVLVALL